MNPNSDDPERRLIRDAMARLLNGDPIRSDGKLTVKSLAAEAGLKRWYLTHRHTDLRDEFYDRVRAQGTTPAAMTTLHEQIATLKEAHKQDRAALRDAIAQKEIHARETQVRALENAQLKAQASGLAPVRPCGCPKIRSCALTRHGAQRPPGPADPPNQQHTCLETQNRHDATDSSASTDMRPDQPRPGCRHPQGTSKS